MRLNKICGLEDFADPELASVIREVSGYKLACLPDLPRAAEHRKDWEVAMAVLALRRCGALRPDATVLGVAAGTEDTLFYLTNQVRQVFATDRYVGPGDWGPVAPASMIVEPSAAAPCDFDINRLVVQHMDARSLRYPDDTFDGVFSSGSIEHVGELMDVANAAYEMGRVLKPGGVLTLATELQISGPPGGIGWPFATLIFSPADLQRYIVEATGLEPVDDLSVDVSAATMATKQSLAGAIVDHQARIARLGRPGEVDYTCWQFPHVVLEHEGYVFASVHLALRKTDRYPLADNGWARPPAATLEAIRSYNLSLVAPPATAAGPADPAAVPSGLDPGVAELVGDAEVRRRIATVDEHRAAVVAQLDELAARRARLQPVATPERLEALAVPGADIGGAPVLSTIPRTSRWTTNDVVIPGGPSFTVLLDPDVADPVTAALAGGRVLDEHLVGLMLALVNPGDLVLDLGAHVGSFSLAAAAAGCRVVAVEASPANVALLRASAARNGFADLHVVHAAVSDAPGTLDFCARGPWGHVATEAVDLPTITVPAVTVDELLAELGMGRPAFVKIDIEGSEIPAIRGMAGLLGTPDAPTLLYESNGHTLGLFGVRPPALTAELDALGYTSLAVEPDRLVRVVPGQIQPHTIVDCLAVKHDVALPGRPAVPPLTYDERVGRIVADGRHPNPDHRAYIGGALSGAEAEVLSHPAVVETLDLLLVDPEEPVRRAVAWWPHPSANRPAPLLANGG
jgi:FkbM family methyltransferase